MGMPPMNQPPMGGAPGGQPGGGMDFAGSLQQLQASLPPSMQSKLDPSNPITQLMFKRLRDEITDDEGFALMEMVSLASPAAFQGLKKVLPEIVVLLDIFDDGELNDSVGGGGASTGAPIGAPPPSNRPELPQGAPRARFTETDGADDDEPVGGGAASRLSAIRA